MLSASRPVLLLHLFWSVLQHVLEGVGLGPTQRVVC